MKTWQKITLSTLIQALFLWLLALLFNPLRWATDVPREYGLPFVYQKKGAYMLGGSINEFYLGYFLLDLTIFLIVAFVISYIKYRKK